MTVYLISAFVSCVYVELHRVSVVFIGQAGSSDSLFRLVITVVR